MQPLKPYNRMQMQLASNSVLSQPPLAAMPQLSEKPRLGFATKKTAWNPGPNVCNFTVTLGLQVVVSENGVRETYSARYYNPNTGRFLSRDPEEGKVKMPATLHKYLYANGDPVNMADPRGRDAFDEYGFVIPSQVDEVASIARFGKVVLKEYECIRWALAWAAETGGDPGSAWLMYLYCMGGF